MKKLAFLLIFALILFSCKKSKEITYPTNTASGENLLNLTVVEIDKDYSIAAMLGKKAKLKIVLTNLSPIPANGGMQPIWFYTSEQGWTVSDYSSDNTQTFTSNQTGTIDLNITFIINGGSCRIDFYENSEKITKTKTFTW
ncbi:MAG: hypothetical protein WC044_07735 [Crocinitomicaceae bacterium]